jgi:hypothetical protein
MTQFDFCAQPDVPRQQTQQRRIGQTRKIPKPEAHSGTRPSIGSLQEVVQPENVVLEKAAEISLGGLDAVQPEAFPHQRCVRPAGKIQALRRAWDLEFRGESARKSVRSGPMRPNQSAVDIEEDNANHPASLPAAIS